MAIFIIFIIFLLLAAWMAWFFISHDRGEKEPIGYLWLAAGLGLVGAFAASILDNLLVSETTVRGAAPIDVTFVAAMSVGVIEELCKCLPLALILYPKRFFNEHTDGIIYFALAGMSFGLIENLLYTATMGSGAGIGRLFMTPFFHAATTSIVGYFLIRGKLMHQTRKLAWVGVVLAIVLHGLYDFGLFWASGSAGIDGTPTATGLALGLMSLCITIGVSVTMFFLYAKATSEDQKLGLSAVGKNKFCRNCGFPNTGRGLYCTQCGKYA